MRWLLSPRRKEGNTASSVVVYLENEVFLPMEGLVPFSRADFIPEGVFIRLREGFRCHTRGSWLYILEF